MSPVVGGEEVNAKLPPIKNHCFRNFFLAAITNRTRHVKLQTFLCPFILSTTSNEPINH